MVTIILNTDYTPGNDFIFVETYVYQEDNPERNQIFITGTAEKNFERGANVAQFSNFNKRRYYTIVVKLLDSRGRVVDMRITSYGKGKFRNRSINVTIAR